MAEITLVAEPGRPTGSAASRRLRAAGRIPAVVYGHGIEPGVAVSVDGRDLRHALSGEPGLNAAAVPRGRTGRPTWPWPGRSSATRCATPSIHVDFQIVRRDEVISAEVPDRPGRRGQRPSSRSRASSSSRSSASPCSATPDRIPNSIEVDITDLAVGDTIRVGDLALPDGRDHRRRPRRGRGRRPRAQPSAAEVEADRGAEAEAEAARPARSAAGGASRRRGGLAAPTGRDRARPPTCSPSGSATRAPSTRAPATTPAPTWSPCWPPATAAASSGQGEHALVAEVRVDGRAPGAGLPADLHERLRPGRRPARAPLRHRRTWPHLVVVHDELDLPLGRRAGQGRRRPGRPQRAAVDQGPPPHRRLHPGPHRHRQAARAARSRAPTTSCAAPGRARAHGARRQSSRWRPTPSSASSTDGVAAAQNRFNGVDVTSDAATAWPTLTG